MSVNTRDMEFKISPGRFGLDVRDVLDGIQ